MIFTEAMKLYCKKHKISVRQLEKEAGVSYRTINRFFNGKSISHVEFGKIENWSRQTRTAATADVRVVSDEKRPISA